MIRRRLFAYTVMLVSGICAAFICWERAEVIAGTLFILCVSLIIARADIYERIEKLDRERLLFCVMAGFVMFSFAFFDMNRDLMDRSDCSISGVVDSVTVKDNRYELVIGPDNRAFGKRVLLNCYTEGYSIAEVDFDRENIYELIGRRISANGKLNVPKSRDNPGCFDYKLYLNSRGIKYSLTATSLSTSEEKNVYNILHSEIMKARSRFEQLFTEAEIRALVKGVIFGDKGEIDQDTRNEFNENGTGHILAVSGLHIGFLFSLLRALTKRRRTFSVSICIVGILFIYGEMTMWSPSTVRAFVVMTVSLLSIKLQKRADMLTSVSFAACILLTNNPYQLFNSGFQMSFIAMLGIAFLTEPLSIIIGDYLSVMLAVQLAVAPYTAFVFHRFNPLSVFINIPIVFVGSIIVPVCIVGIMLLITAGCMPDMYYQLICGLMQLLLKLNHILNCEGRWSFYTVITNSGLLVLSYLIMLLSASEWTRVMLIRKDHQRIHKALLMTLMPAILLSCATYNSFIDDEIVFVSVGQGDCTHVRFRNADILIDGGGDFERNIGTQILLPYLLSNGAENVDNAFVTHLHTDHYKGLFELSQVYDVERLTLSKVYRVNCDCGFENPRYIDCSYRYIINDRMSIMPVWPIESTVPDPDFASDEANELNMVYIVFCNGRKIMVTGDLLEEDERDMVQYYSGTDVLKCDILKVAHHGSRSSSSELFLDAVNPQIAVISVGANNMYGHPHAQTIERLESRGIETYRTDINGAVGIDIGRRGRIRVDLIRPAQPDKQEG